MKNTKLLFETEITDGLRYRKLKPIFMYVIGGLSIMPLIYNVILEREQNFNTDVWFLPYTIFIILLIIAGIVLNFYLERKIVKGYMKIFENQILIENGTTININLDNIENFEIQRGSTYHYTHQVGNEIIKLGNYIRFKNNNESKEYEFIIDSKKKNAAFESMIQTLQKNRIKLHYTSI